MSENSSINKEQIGYFKNPRTEMLRYIPSSALRILDVGCGEGGFCKLLTRSDREIWGVEINPESAEKASQICSSVLIGDFNFIHNQLPQNYFDCVIFNDVLEHFYAPWDNIRAVKSLLASGGVLITSIPNFRFMPNLIIEIFYHGEFQYRTEGGILDDTHIRFFTSKSIRRMFREQGYEILSHEGINPDDRIKARIIRGLTFGFLKDTRFKQFATVGKPVKI